MEPAGMMLRLCWSGATGGYVRFDYCDPFRLSLWMHIERQLLHIAFSHPADQSVPEVIVVLGCIGWFTISLLPGEMHVHAWNQVVLKTSVQESQKRYKRIDE